MKKVSLIKPFTPPLEDLMPYLERIMESRHLTNNGPVHLEFEEALCKYLDVTDICLTTSGTMALALALKALGLQGEIITTPFTAVATVQAIHWNNLKPVFVDVCEDDLNINPIEIEKAITAETSAILPVHIFGIPCQVNEIERLAKRYSLKVIYDAAHCFGVTLNGKSICNYGDLSTLSFHATKVFNSLEGGAIICRDEGQKRFIDALINNGVDRNRELVGYGLNAKMNEIQAAFGLLELDHVDKLIDQRGCASMIYRNLLEHVEGITVIEEKESVRNNYSYFPVLIDPEVFGSTRDDLARRLDANGVVTRNYFYPLVSDYSLYSKYKRLDLPVAKKIAERILCLPLYPDLTEEDIERVVSVIRDRN